MYRVRGNVVRKALRVGKFGIERTNLLSSGWKTTEQALITRRNFWSSWDIFGSKTRGLQEDADASPLNPRAQTAYMRQLYEKGRHEEVLERFQDPKIAVDIDGFIHFVKASLRTESLTKESLLTGLNRLAESKHLKAAAVGYEAAVAEFMEKKGEVGDKDIEEAAKSAALAALAATQITPKTELKTNDYRKFFDAISVGMSTATPSTGANVLAGGNSKPLLVRVDQGGIRQVLLRFLSSLLFFLLAAAILRSVIEDSIGGRLSSGPLGQNTFSPSTGEKSDKTFADVMGIDEARAELEEIVDYLRDPQKYTKLGARLPRGCLLMGPPGTGKTLLARAIAGEAKVPFFHASGSQFEEMYVGVGARRVRDLFEQAKKVAPCIIFIDEIDAIGGSRLSREQQVMKMTLNQLLVEMDGFDQTSGIIVIGATNLPDSLDSALTRPGRFDRHVYIHLPDIVGREQILNLYGKKIPLSKDVDLRVLAKGTPGMSGADLSNLINQAAIAASSEGRTFVTMADLEYSKDKILMGVERKSAVLSPKTVSTTAYHEGGHALVAVKTEGADPVHKATVIPRGGALGMVTQLPDGDQTSMSKKQMIARLDVCMGGRVAEELIFGPDNVTSGASSDLQQASKLARAMVTKYGMSEKLGYVFHTGKEEEVSPSTKELIDKEVKMLLDDAYNRAKDLLTKNRGALERLAKSLMEYETLTGEEVKAIIAGKRIKPPPKTKKMIVREL